MWKEAIEAIQQQDSVWVLQNRSKFSQFFRAENIQPQGKLSAPALQVHYQEKLFKMYLDKSYNGLALALDEGSKWIEKASTLDGNWGWLLAIGVGGAYFADYCEPKIAQHYFSPKEALVAGSGKPSNKAKKIDADQWQINGSWSYCSGSEQASLFTAVTLKDDKTSALILPVNQVKLQRDWNAVGLPLTCSHSIIAENAVIPENHFFDLSKSPRTNDYPISTYPFQLFALACFAPVITGISIALFLEIAAFLEQKKELWKTHQPQRYELIFEKVKNFEKESTLLKNSFYATLKESWQNHLQEKDLPQEEILRSGKLLAEFCFTESSAIIPKLGMAALKKEHPIQLLWKDLQTAYQHGIFHQY